MEDNPGGVVYTFYTMDVDSEDEEVVDAVRDDDSKGPKDEKVRPRLVNGKGRRRGRIGSATATLAYERGSSYRSNAKLRPRCVWDARGGGGNAEEDEDDTMAFDSEGKAGGDGEDNDIYLSLPRKKRHPLPDLRL